MGEDFFEENGDQWEDDDDEFWALFEQLEDEEEKWETEPGISVGQHYDRVVEEKLEEKDEEFKRKANMFKDYWHR